MFDLSDIERAIGIAQKAIQVIGLAGAAYERTKKARKAPPKRR